MKASQPDFSIVIPAFNEGRWIEETVKSVLATASGYEVEVILIDDGSTDDGFDFVNGRSGDARVQLIRGTGLGVARARATGADAASGVKLIFLDAHVTPSAEWLTYLDELLADPSIGLAGATITSLSDNGAKGNIYTVAGPDLAPGWHYRDCSEPFETPAIAGACMACRAEWYRACGGFDPGFRRYGREEIELALRCWLLGFRCVTDPRVEIRHRFKTPSEQGFAVSWDEVDYNTLRCAQMVLGSRRLQHVFSTIGMRPSAWRATADLMNDECFQERRHRLRSRFVRDDEWLFARFADELAGFGTEGTRLIPSDKQYPADDERCAACGAPFEDGDRFCGSCGSALEVPQRAGTGLKSSNTDADKEIDVSIVVPHLNDWPGLWFTVHNLLMDIREDGIGHELIVADNGSTPDVRLRVNDLFTDGRLADSPCHLIEEPLAGAPNCRNAGARVARGRYLFFLDSHVICGRGFFRRAVELMNTRPEIGILHAALSATGRGSAAFSYSYDLDLEKSFWGSHCYRRKRETPYPVAMFGHAALVVRRQQFIDLGLYGDCFKGYGGEEPYLDLKYWLCGSQVWVDPALRIIHYPGPRNYVASAADYYRNFMMAAYAIGGKGWLERIYNEDDPGASLPRDVLASIRLQARQLAEPERRVVQARQLMDLDQLLLWFRTAGVVEPN